MEISELKNKLIKMKNSVDGFHSRMEGTEERIDKLEDKTIEMTQSQESFFRVQRENRLKRNGQSLKDLTCHWRPRRKGRWHG